MDEEVNKEEMKEGDGQGARVVSIKVRKASSRGRRATEEVEARKAKHHGQPMDHTISYTRYPPALTNRCSSSAAISSTNLGSHTSLGSSTGGSRARSRLVMVSVDMVSVEDVGCEVEITVGAKAEAVRVVERIAV